MRDYGQFCPIARASEVLAERWTPVILRNVLDGCRTFNEIAAGAPGLSRSLLVRRLHEFEIAGLIVVRANEGGRGPTYEPTDAGHPARSVLNALAAWGTGISTSGPSPPTRWHLELVSWPQLLKQHAMAVSGPSRLSRELPGWNAQPELNAWLRNGGPAGFAGPPPPGAGKVTAGTAR